MRNFFLFLFFLFSLVSCEPEETTEFCDEINLQLDYCYCSSQYDSLEVDISGDGNIDISFSVFEVYGSGGSTRSRGVRGKNQFEIARTAATSTKWTYDPIYYPDTQFYISNYFIPKQFMQGDTIPNDTTFNSQYLSFGGSSGNGSMPPDPFQHGSSTTNTWNLNGGQGFIIFRNQDMGIMGWIKMDLYGSPTIIRSHYEITDTLVIDESICQ